MGNMLSPRGRGAGRPAWLRLTRVRVLLLAVVCGCLGAAGAWAVGVTPAGIFSHNGASYVSPDGAVPQDPNHPTSFGDADDLQTLKAPVGVVPPGTGTVSGHVTDAQSGQPVGGANMGLSLGAVGSGASYTTTGADGAYTFAGLANGTYNLAASRYTISGTLPLYQLGTQMHVVVSGPLTVDFALNALPVSGSRGNICNRAQNLILIDYDETYYESWFSDTQSMVNNSPAIHAMAAGGVNATQNWTSYGWSPIDHYQIAVGGYPAWRTPDAPAPVWGQPDGLDTNIWYGGSEHFLQESIFDVAKGHGMSTGVIGGSDYPTGHITDANVDLIQLAANPNGVPYIWATEVENFITAHASNPNGFFIYLPATMAEGRTVESTSPDAAGGAFQTASSQDDQAMLSLLQWLQTHGYMSNTVVASTADEAENDHTAYDNFYGNGATGMGTTRHVPFTIEGPGIVTGPMTYTVGMNMDDESTNLLAALNLPPNVDSRGQLINAFFQPLNCGAVTPTPVPPSHTPGPSVTRTPSATPAPPPSATPSITPTRAPTNTPAPSPTPAPTNTPAPSATTAPTQTPGGPTATQVPSNTPSPTPTETACAITFTDVPVGSPFYFYIHCLVCRGIVGGYGDGTFRPYNNVTRGQMAKFVANAAAYADAIPAGQQTFRDVPNAQPFWLYVERAALHGVVSGYACGGPGEPCPGLYFRPYANVTRGQTAKFVANAAGYAEVIPPSQQSFSDVVNANPFWLYIERVYLHGIISGYTCGAPPAGACDPQNRPYFLTYSAVTRGQTAKFISNSFFPNCQALTPTPGAATQTPGPPAPTSTSPPGPSSTPGPPAPTATPLLPTPTPLLPTSTPAGATATPGGATATPTPAGLNLVVNGDFETGNISPWTTALGGGSAVVVTTPVYAGTYAGQVTTGTSGSSGVGGGGSCAGGNRIPITPSTTYSWSGWILVPSGTTLSSARIRVAWYSVCSGGAQISTSDSSLVTSATGTWIQVTGSATAPAGAAFAEVRLYGAPSTTAPITLYFDEVLMH